MAIVDISRNTNSWGQYMQPTQRIHSGASRVNKLTIVKNKLCYNKVECADVVSPEKGIDNFVNHLHKHYPDGVVLLAHNGARFDFPLLKRDLERNGKTLTQNYPIECIDSIKIFKKHFPDLEAYNQPYLIERFLGSENVSDAHEAVGDCINLRNALEAAAQEKNMSISEFIELPSKKLIIDEVKKNTEKVKVTKTKTSKVLKNFDGKSSAGKDTRLERKTAQPYLLRRRRKDL